MLAGAPSIICARRTLIPTLQGALDYARRQANRIDVNAAKCENPASVVWFSDLGVALGCCTEISPESGTSGCSPSAEVSTEGPAEGFADQTQESAMKLQSRTARRSRGAPAQRRSRAPAGTRPPPSRRPQGGLGPGGGDCVKAAVRKLPGEAGKEGARTGAPVGAESPRRWQQGLPKASPELTPTRLRSLRRPGASTPVPANSACSRSSLTIFFF